LGYKFFVRLYIRPFHEIVLVGGSTRGIPRIKRLLEDYFGGEYLNCGVPQMMLGEDAAVYGAAVQAVSINNMNKIGEMLLLDVSPFSLGIEVS
jgi:molecular chaperone DnaK (HSP70)